MVAPISIEERDLANQHLDRCISFSMCGKIDQAIAEAEKALEIDPEFAQAYNKLGDFYMKKGWIQKAADSFKKSIEFNPENENSHFDLGCAQAHLGDYSSALETLKKALQLNPQHTEVYAHIGLIYLKSGQVEDAVNFLDRAAKNNSDNLMANYHLAIALKLSGRDSESVNYFNKVIERYRQLVNFKSKFAEGYYYIGRSYFYMGNVAEAIKNLQNAVEFDTEEVDYHYSFGMLYSDADAFFALAEAQKEAGMIEDAKTNLNEALKLAPDNETFLKLKSEIG
jgi:superkiller protein 3